MPYSRKQCRKCGKPATAKRRISHTGRCFECAAADREEGMTAWVAHMAAETRKRFPDVVRHSDAAERRLGIGRLDEEE